MCQLISLSGAHHLPSWAVREQRRAWGLLGWEESLLGRAIREGSMGEGFTCHVYLALKVEGECQILESGAVTAHLREGLDFASWYKAVPGIMLSTLQNIRLILTATLLGK